MDVSNPRERIVSILNDNDCPSFAIRRAASPTPKVKEPQSFQHHFFLPLPKLERPQLYRFQEYAKQLSPASEPSTPPLLRHHSSSSSSSSSSSAMENSPSPVTPEYPYLDAQSHGLLPYDVLVQQAQSYLPSPTTITPLIEQGMMIAPPPLPQDPSLPFAPKMTPQFPPMPSPVAAVAAVAQQPVMPMPDAQIQPAVLPQPPAQQQQHQQQTSVPKKNKYPCPYAQSHGCLATFTTSGHAARHGKKHTGEKSVHCPTCGKAFTRKDNMKQHERTHKNSSSAASNASDDSRKSKATITKAAVAERAHHRATSEAKSSTSSGRKDSLQQASPLSEVTSAADGVQPSLTTPNSNAVSLDDQGPLIFADDSIAAPAVSIPQPESVMSAYPPLDEATLGQINQRPMPAFPRTYSDLDTLAMAATYDPYNNGATSGLM